jgi:hypothetical protein
MRQAARLHRSSNRWCSKTRRQAVSTLLLVSGAHNADMDYLSERYDLKLTRCEVRRVRDETGFAIGGVAPIGHLRPITVHIDRSLMDHAVVWAAAGRPDSVFSVDPQGTGQGHFSRDHRRAGAVVDQPHLRALLRAVTRQPPTRRGSRCAVLSTRRDSVRATRRWLGRSKTAARELPASAPSISLPDAACRHMRVGHGLHADQGQGPRMHPTPQKPLPNGRGCL